MEIAKEYAKTEVRFIPLETLNKLNENEYNMLHVIIQEAFMNGYNQRVQETSKR